MKREKHKKRQNSVATTDAFQLRTMWQLATFSVSLLLDCRLAAALYNRKLADGHFARHGHFTHPSPHQTLGKHKQYLIYGKIKCNLLWQLRILIIWQLFSLM